MKLLIVIPNLDLGGAEKQLLTLLPELRKKGFEISIFCTDWAGVLADKFIEKGVAVTSLSSAPSLKSRTLFFKLWSVFRSTMKLRIFIRKWRFDVVHAYLPKAYLVSALSLILTRKPLFLMSRRSLNNYQKKHKVLALLERFLHKRVDGVTANSQAIATQLMEEGLPPDKLTVIYNGVDTQRYSSDEGVFELTGRYKLDPTAFTLVTVANLIPYKGHADLFQACKFFDDSYKKPWQILCVGKITPYQKKLDTMVVQLGLQTHVRWMGSCETVEEIYALADCGVLASHEEGFSNSVLEGMACGTPMLVTNVGGNAEAVITGETGFVVPAHAPELLAERMLELANNTEKRQNFGLSARKRVVKLFSVERLAENYNQYYQKQFSKRVT